MPDHVTLTEAGLRDALRDPRYWTPGPERAAYAAWVSDGYKALYNSGEAKGGTVKVRAYGRTRDGKTEHVGAHTRGAPPGGMATPVMLGPAVNGARALTPIIPPVIGGIIQGLPRPDLRGLFARSPESARPSLLGASGRRAASGHRQRRAADRHARRGAGSTRNGRRRDAEYRDRWGGDRGRGQRADRNRSKLS